jgi:hypothetical protein
MGNERLGKAVKAAIHRQKSLPKEVKTIQWLLPTTIAGQFPGHRQPRAAGEKAARCATPGLHAELYPSDQEVCL